MTIWLASLIIRSNLVTGNRGGGVDHEESVGHCF